MFDSFPARVLSFRKSIESIPLVRKSLEKSEKALSLKQGFGHKSGYLLYFRTAKAVVGLTAPLSYSWAMKSAIDYYAKALRFSFCAGSSSFCNYCAFPRSGKAFFVALRQAVKAIRETCRTKSLFVAEII